MRKYDSIYDSLQNNQGYIEETEGINISNSLQSNNLYTQNPVKQNMKDELKKYLSELSGSGGNKVSDNNSNVGATSMESYTTTPAVPDFAISNMSSSSSSTSFSSSYAEY